MKLVLFAACCFIHLSLVHSEEKSYSRGSLSPNQLAKNRFERRNQRFQHLFKSKEDNKGDSNERSREVTLEERRPKFRSAELALANEHFLQMTRNHSCQTPRPRLVYMKDLFFSPDKIYMPRCTVLHKCDDESGCCSSEGHECAPKRQQAVQRYFLVMMRNMTQSVEAVTFSNHTECECRPINHHPRSYTGVSGYEALVKDIIGSDRPEVLAFDSVPNFDFAVSNLTNNHIPDQQITGATETSSASGREDDVKIKTSIEEKHLKEQLCAHIRCPEPFSTVTVFPSSCTCDCVKRGEPNCEKIKRGLRRLTGAVASCVRRGLCHVPVCEYAGDFDMMKGMCPKKGSDNSQNIRHNKKHYVHERD